jgi:hypothetical protein
MSKHESRKDDNIIDRGESRDRESREDDLLLRQVRAALTPMPEVDRRAIASILAAVADRKPTRIERLRASIAFTFDRWMAVTSPLARGTALAAAALTIGFVARGYLSSTSVRESAATSSVAVAADSVRSATAVQQVEGAASVNTLRIPAQFVLDAREAADATSLSVVGDFNDWDVNATPMTLEGGAWNVTLPVTPGRHVYAFVVNGTRWIADPRAPKATDSDFGRPGSVIIVQTP